MDKSAGYAIVVTGKQTNSSLLEMHNTSADAIVNTLKKRGFLDTNINILKSMPNVAISKAQIQSALTTWAKTKLADSAAPLYLIMVDHGSPTGFILGSETLTPDELKTWLDTLEADSSVASAVNSYKRIIIIGSCYSGQFVTPLSKQGRVVITSAGSDEESIAGIKMWDINSSSFLTGGEYFVDSLFTFLGRGDDLKDAFIRASGSLPARDVRRITNGYHYGVYDSLAQHPLLDDNGDNRGSYQLTGTDGQIAATLKLGEGVTTNSGSNPADIKSVTPQTTIDSNTTSTSIWLQANLDARVGTAWVEIRTPDTTTSGSGTGGQVIINLTSQTLTHNATTGKWEATWNGFSAAGRYDLFYYTTDIQTGEQSAPEHSTIYKNKASNTAPTAFSLLSPSDETTVYQTFATTWQESSDSDGFSYTLEIGTDQNFTNIVYSEQDIQQAFTVIPDTALKDPGNSSAYICQNGDSYCWWRIRAIDNYGETTTSTAARNFTIIQTNGLPGVIKGFLRTSGGTPIAGAAVSIGTGPYTSLSNGAYLITAPTGSYTLTVTATGYQQSSSSVTVKAGTVTTKDVQLQTSVVGQTITFTPQATATYGETPITLTATGGGSGNQVTFSVTSGPATLTGNTLTITGAGTIVVKASQAGNSNYTAAPDVTASIVVAKASLTITAVAKNKTYGASDPALTYTTSGLVSPDTMTGSLTRTTGEAVGNYPITQGTVTVSASGNYTISYTGANLIIGKTTPAITWSTPADITYGTVLSGTQLNATSGGVAGAFVYTPPAGTVLNAGNSQQLSVTFTPSDSISYNTPAAITTTINVSTKALTITANNISRAYGVANPTAPGFTAPALVGSDSIGSVSYTYAASATAAAEVGSTHSITPSSAVFTSGTASNYNITYTAGTLTIAGGASQSITFNPPTTATYGDSAITLSATATSGLPVTFFLVNGPATLAGSILTITGPGTITVRASQILNSSHYRSTRQAQRFGLGKSHVKFAPIIVATLPGEHLVDPVQVKQQNYCRRLQAAECVGEYQVVLDRHP